MEQRKRRRVGKGEDGREAKVPPPLESIVTKEMRCDLLARQLVSALKAYIDMVLEAKAEADDWIDQSTSPLGHFGHIRAIKSGQLPGVKHGKRLLVRRADLNSYLAKFSVSRTTASGADDASIPAHEVEHIAAEVLTHIGLRLQRKH